MDKRTIFFVFVLFCLSLTGCPDKVNYSKGESVAESYIKAEMIEDQNMHDKVLASDFNMHFEGEENFLKDYSLKNPELIKINSEELKSDRENKIITTSYVIKDKTDREVNGVSVFLLKKENDKWLISNVKNASIEQTIK